MVIRHNQTVIDRANLTITHNGKEYKFRSFKNETRGITRKGNNVLFEVFTHIFLNGWTTAEQLFDAVYGDCPNGGPVAGEHIIDVRIKQHEWMSRIAAMGFELIREKRGGKRYFNLKIISESSDANQ